MTAIATHASQPLRSVSARRDAEAALRRQQALARLAARRMPLPGHELSPAERLARGSRPGLAAYGHGYGHRHPSGTAGSDAMAPAGTTTTGGAARPRPSLTAREVEVLRTWMLVDSKPAVAQQLYISLGTVNTHLTRIRAKYAEIGRPAPTKASLVARAIQDEIMTLDEL